MDDFGKGKYAVNNKKRNKQINVEQKKEIEVLQALSKLILYFQAYRVFRESLLEKYPWLVAALGKKYTKNKWKCL